MGGGAKSSCPSSPKRKDKEERKTKNEKRRFDLVSKENPSRSFRSQSHLFQNFTHRGFCSVGTHETV